MEKSGLNTRKQLNLEMVPVGKQKVEVPPPPPKYICSREAKRARKDAEKQALMNSPSKSEAGSEERRQLK